MLDLNFITEGMPKCAGTNWKKVSQIIYEKIISTHQTIYKSFIISFFISFHFLITSDIEIFEKKITVLFHFMPIQFPNRNTNRKMLQIDHFTRAAFWCIFLRALVFFWQFEFDSWLEKLENLVPVNYFIYVFKGTRVTLRLTKKTQSAKWNGLQVGHGFKSMSIATRAQLTFCFMKYDQILKNAAEFITHTHKTTIMSCRRTTLLQVMFWYLRSYNWETEMDFFLSFNTEWKK